MKKRKRLLVLLSALVLVLMAFVPLVVEAGNYTCKMCGNKNCTLTYSSTNPYSISSTKHRISTVYTCHCPNCGPVYDHANDNDFYHSIKTKITRYPKKNLKVTKKYCTECDYSTETYGPIDPKKPWASPR